MNTLTPTEARRLAVTAQRLAGPRPPATKEGILEIFRSLNCVQIDPIRAVERTQLLVLWSRLGPFDPALLDELQQEDRAIFEAWAHCASFVLTDDYPLFSRWMGRGYTGNSEWHQRVRGWMEANEALQQHILESLAADGPLATGEFDDIAAQPWGSSGWSSGRNVTRMLDFLYGSGRVISVGRRGNQKLWHLLEEWLHEWTEHQHWAEEEVVRQSAQRSLRALGIATARQIKNHFIRGSYPGLEERLAELVEAGRVQTAQIVDDVTGDPWPGDWFIHQDTLPLLASLRAGGWQPRTVFLSPFDNLICDRERTEQMWDFHYRIEIYVPKAKRQYGYYVLPLLHGDRFIGRMDSKLERKSGTCHIHALYPERAEDVTAETGQVLAASLRELAQFIGAKQIALGENIPAVWKAPLS